jgi:hypothetical protein
MVVAYSNLRLAKPQAPSGGFCNFISKFVIY